jgi:hypothetical protein
MVQIKKVFTDVKETTTKTATKLFVLMGTNVECVYGNNFPENPTLLESLYSNKEIIRVKTFDGKDKHINKRYVISAENVTVVRVNYYLPFDNEHRACFYEIPLEETYKLTPSESADVVKPFLKLAY